jgi:hypothetical protein
MDDYTRRRFLRLGAIVLSVVPFPGLAQPRRAQSVDSAAGQYCNQQYAYCVSLPSSGKAEPHEGEAPNHGVTVDLPESGNQLWIYAHWDAALLKGSQEAAFQRLAIILHEHPDAEVSIVRSRMADLTAYRLRFNYSPRQPMVEQIVIAYREPKDESKDTGIIYEIGLQSTQASYASNARILSSFISTFRLE